MQNKQEDDVITHLKQALSHLDEALHITIRTLREDPASKNDMGSLWEEFLGTCFRHIKMVGKESKINLLNLVSFARLKRY
ncbi:hypothetical protein CU633_04085 [Bacillus sp. V3-13]|uniref:hypothetical protein n=1 Tax=Bacillus sp. V3-13 TaxID=2053728 RepID=UPI000C7636B6|nr:hypothetical protein [Bacillus sp. V3-13]PLR78736.1 hypothetical protein CU633_04085 [Bacillus sp. V3-13]